MISEMLVIWNLPLHFKKAAITRIFKNKYEHRIYMPTVSKIKFHFRGFGPLNFFFKKIIINIIYYVIEFPQLFT